MCDTIVARDGFTKRAGKLHSKISPQCRHQHVGGVLSQIAI